MRRAGALAIALAACAAPPVESASLGGDVARVGGTRIGAALVARAATARGASPRDALAALVDDALAAEGARARGLDATPAAVWASTAARARLVAARFGETARASGPPTDDELAQATAFRWLELDLPEQVRVVHVVVRRPKIETPEAVARAKALAAAILAAVADASSADDFLEKARAVEHGGVEVVVQPLPPFVEDGRVAAPGNQKMDPAFTKAAFALAAPGATSGVTESPFGWHVIRLVERLPAKRVGLEERRALLTEEIYVARARGLREALLAQLRAKHPVVIAPAAESMMAAALPGSP